MDKTYVYILNFRIMHKDLGENLRPNFKANFEAMSYGWYSWITFKYKV
jgi:hypothetical protein